jgi:signal transduction histidine kinase
LATAVQRATELVRQTLDFAREGPPPLKLAWIELAPLVEDVVHAIAAAAPNLQVENRIDADSQVLGDRDHLFRVFTNLLRNAAEAGAGSTVISVRNEGATTAVEISDNGPGLPASVRAQLFRPFTQGGRAGGTGLGLAIVRDLMRAQGGDVALATSGPDGTTFRLTLASAPAHAPAMAQGRHERARSA